MGNLTLIAATVRDADRREYDGDTNWSADMADLQEIWRSANVADRRAAVVQSWDHSPDRRGPGHPNLLVRYLTEDV